LVTAKKNPAIMLTVSKTAGGNEWPVFRPSLSGASPWQCEGHGAAADDPALHMTVTSFDLILRLSERDLRRKGNVDHRRPAFGRTPVAK
jgi:hypothetical protein